MRSLTLVTYNVWFGLRAFEERSGALLGILARTGADVIALQEVTTPLLERALREEWVRASYVVSDATRETVRDYGVVILSRLPVSGFVLHDLTSGMGRKLLVARVHVNGRELAVATAHFESLRESEAYREKQFKETFKILKPFENAILMGDFNMCSTWKENARLDPAYVDLWPMLHPDDPGWTQDTERNAMLASRKEKSKCVRFDRILVRAKPGVLKAAEIGLIGTEPISGKYEHRNVFPSDHFGLRAVLSIAAGK